MFSQGTLQETGIPTDVAIEGDGFFKVLMPGGGERFTRNGSFRIDANGLLVTADGFLVDGNITLPADAPLNGLRIGVDGTVSVREPHGFAK